MKKCLKIYLIITLIIALLVTFNTSAFAVVEQARTQKVDSLLLEYMDTADEDELIPINIFLQPIDSDSLMEAVKRETGMDPAVYMDEECFQKEIVSEITDLLEKELGYEETHRVVNELSSQESLTEETISNLRSAFSGKNSKIKVDVDNIIEFCKTDRSVSVLDYTILQIRQNFQKEKNRVIKEEQSAANDLFISTYVNERNNDVTYANRYISSLYLKATKNDILYYSQKPEVISIHYDDPKFKLTSTMSKVSGQVGADWTNGTKGSSYNNGNGFQGTGITIGILEFEGVCDTTSPHYDSSRIHRIKNGNISLVTSTHASLVTAIAAGNRVAFEGYVYTGIAPEAEVYITSCKDTGTVFSGLDLLADNGVNVINISLGFVDTHKYTYIDRDLDQFIDNTGIQCVVAAGNNSDEYGDGSTYVTSPGYALNCITVGNLRTKSSGSSIIGLTPYDFNTSSSWQEPDSLPNKPEICAPGTWIRAVRSKTGSNNFYYDLERQIDPNAEPSGTSFSAPIVTGIIAQMLQSQTARIGRPQAIKAKIMNTATANKVTTTDNAIAGNNYLREKSGAGMVNSINAVKWLSYKHAWNHQAVETEYITQITKILSKDQKIRATLAFSNRNTGVIITGSSQYYDMDLRIIDENGNVLCSSATARNNVEIVEYTATEDCTIYIQTKIFRNLSNVKTDWALEVDQY